ncbi:MAG: OmcA/MtrC family decaheme c-type cytochrome, partial [Acidobacteriota bacterium]|nr:OmcA/MtrC family decaheme c-type cytochrome [Acidobacteriota bacterium]
CHSPQTVNPDTQLTQDMPVLIHKIHMGKNLPSVQSGTPYRIWHRGRWSDFSDVGFPGGTDELKNCAICHQGASQADQYKTAPSRAACGACHDNVDFASGKNHVNLPQVSDNLCANCHPAQGNDFDTSVTGAHVVSTKSKQLPGVVFAITAVDNAKPGQKPAVSFTVKDDNGNPVDISKMTRFSLTMAGPTTDYANYVSEDARKASTSGGQYVYTFTAALPNDAAGTFVVGAEGYNTVTVNPGTVNAASVRDSGTNVVFYFGVNGVKAVPRRQIVSQAKCVGCHTDLPFHGGQRNQVEYCVVCHNPNLTDISQRNAGDTAQSVNFKNLIHKIHTGANLTSDYTVMGHNKSVNNYNDIGYPGDRRDCQQCHLPGTYNLPVSDGQINQASPRDYITSMPPVTAACLSCHTTKAAASHALVMTSPLGESCDSCHGPNAEASVSKVHSR